jgi:hypothetical protein
MVTDHHFDSPKQKPMAQAWHSQGTELRLVTLPTITHGQLCAQT